MKKSISRILCAALATALVVPSFAVESQVQEEIEISDEVAVYLSDEAAVYLSDEAHVYTVLPGTEEWVEMTPRERRASCAVSKEEVEGMTTRALVETVVNYPYLINMYAYDKFDMGVQAVAESFPGLEELLSREDAGTALAEYENERARLRSANSEDDYDIQSDYARSLGRYIDKIEEQEAEQEATSRRTVYVWTPNQSRVAVEYNMTWEECCNHIGAEVFDEVGAEEQVDYLCRTYPEAELLYGPSPTYNCHSYAWHEASITNKYWMDDPSAYMTDGSYVRATPDVDCRVAYRETDGDYRHSGIVTSVSGSVTTVESKWGPLGVFSHAINDCPYVGNSEQFSGSVVVSCWELA